jgi:TonB family protein
MSQYLREPRGLSRRTVALGGIVGLHVLVVYMFASGLAIKWVQLPDTPTFADVTEAPRPPAEAPPQPPDPTLQRVTVDTVPVPSLVEPPLDLTDDTARISLPEIPLIVPATPSAVTEAPATIRVLGQNHLPNSEDYYPPDMRRLGIEGATVVQACVDEQGALVHGSPTVEQSSGNVRLDTGALNVARAGRYARSVQGTTPVPNCFRFRIGFLMR